MRVIISAGGTGGHIYPALAIINKIKEKEPNSEILYIGTHNRMEKDIIPENGIPFKSIEIYGFKKSIKKNIKAFTSLIKAMKDCKKIIKEFNPDIVIGFGGYVTVPVIRCAKKFGYKTFLHEQNSIPGKANKFLARYCDLIGISFESSKKYLPNDKTILTGNPCSEDALKVSAFSKAELGFSANKKLVLVVMGSLGSVTINEYFLKTMRLFENKDYEVLFITGKDNYDEFKKIKLPKCVKIVPFYEGLTKVMKRTDLIITRSGASTLSEIIALEVPAILIPSPFVANNHQYINALDLINKKAALIIEEKNLKDSVLVDKIDELINDEEKLKEMKINLRKLKVNDSATIIYNRLKELVNR